MLADSGRISIPGGSRVSASPDPFQNAYQSAGAASDAKPPKPDRASTIDAPQMGQGSQSFDHVDVNPFITGGAKPHNKTAAKV